MCLAVGVVGACGSDDEGGGAQGPSGCGKTPQNCPSDQTCWPVNTAGHLECTVAPAEQTQGKDCTLLVGQATCAPGLYCFPSVSGTSSGTCQPFCPTGTCSGGTQCFQVGTVGGTETIPVCSPAVDADAGTGGTAGAGSGGTAGAGTGGTAGASSGGTAGTSSGGASGNSGDGG